MAFPQSKEMRVGALIKAVEITNNKYRKQIVEMLYMYPLYKKALEDEFPSCTTTYEESIPGYSEFQSSTERYIIKREHKYNVVRQVDRAVEVLDEDEKVVVETLYLSGEDITMVEASQKIGMSEATIRRKKNSSLYKIAVVLNII